jgi:hypothetical protein
VERLAEALGLPERDVETITRAGRLHDLGKLTVDVAILTKPGRLTEAEFDELKAHPAMSARLLAPFSFAAQEKRLVEHHHERFDGNGYYGVPAARLPIYSHFIILADSWDAMTSDRPYRQALSDSEAAAEIRANLGTQFHPVLGRCFLAVIEGRELHEDLTSEEVAQLHAELASHRDQRFAGARARAERWWRYATWRMLVVPVFVIVAVVAVAPRAGSPIAAVAGLAALAGWWAVSSERRALRRTRRMLAATPVPATVEDVLARVDDRLGLVWVGPLEARAQQLRRSGRGWSSLAPDEVIARIDGLLARTDSRELAAAERSLSRDGSTLALQRTEGRDPMLIVTSGPPLPSAVARSLVQLLISVEVEDALDDVHVARAA